MGGLHICLDNKIIKSSFIKKTDIGVREEKLQNFNFNQEINRTIFKIKIKDDFFKNGFFCNIPLKEEGKDVSINSILINDYLINENDD